MENVAKLIVKKVEEMDLAERKELQRMVI